jgi:hypothetical protein
MLQAHKRWSVVPGLLVVAFLAACNHDDLSSNRSRVGTPSKKVTGGGCPVTKFTGGGRIDPSNPNVNADSPDGASGFASMTGKVTFGFNVFLNDQCNVQKAEIQVVWHGHLGWHVSVHNGVDDFGETVPATTFASPSGRGTCLVVGPMTARLNAGQQGSELISFMEACDNGEPGSQQPGMSSVGPDAFQWSTSNHGDTDLTYLTGGNIQAH